MTWSKKAPQADGYYWFLPTSTNPAATRSWSEQPTVVNQEDGQWTYVGNEMTLDSKRMHGTWWTVALMPPPYA